MTIKLLRLAAVAFCLSATVVRAAIPPAENLLPSDTIAFFTVPDCAAARTAAKVSPAWMFWDDPSMKPFRDKFIAKWNEQYIAPLERDLGIKVGDFTGLPQGQLTLAVTVNGSNGHDDIPPGLLLLMDARDKSVSLKTNLAALTRKWTDAGRAVRTEKIHGMSFTVVPLSSNDFAGILPKKAPVQELGKEPSKPEKPGEIYLAQFDSLLIAGNSPKVVEPVAAHLSGGSAPAIADNPVFAADKLSQFRDNPKYYGWFNGKMTFDMMAQSPAGDGSDDMPPTPFSGLSAQKTLGSLGMSALKSASFALHETREGTLLTVHVTAPESERAGLLKIFALTPRDASVPPFVPADAVKFTRFRLDGKQTWAEIQKMVANISPGGQAGLDSIIKMANSMGQMKNPSFDIRNDLFGNLNDDFITYQKPASGDSLAQISSAPTIFLIAVSNPDAVINVFRTIASISNPQDDTPPREFLGRKIYSIALRQTAVKGGAPQPHALYLASSSGYVALSTESSTVEEFLRNAEGQNKTLRDNPGLQNAMQFIGGAGGGLFGYENQRETMRVTFQALKNTIAADAAMKAFPPALRSWVDFGLLPDFDVVSKYFYISTFAGSANSEGLTFKYYTPRPPQLN